MARLINRLKPLQVSALAKPGSKVGLYGDGARLFLRVTADGKDRAGEGRNLHWIFLYRHGRPAQGRKDNTHSIGLGGFPDVSLATARTKAKALNEQLATGINPKSARAHARTIPTFEAAAREYHTREKDAGKWKSDKHAKQWLDTLADHAFPVFGPTRVDQVTAGDVFTALEDYWSAHPATARRIQGRISTVMQWAIAKEWRTDDPAKFIAARLGHHERKQTHRKSLNFTEVAASIKAVWASDAYITTKLAFEFLVHTGTRSGATRLAEWSEIKDGVWTIPEGAGRKMDHTHTVALSPRALEILEEAAKLNPERTGLIFPSLSGKPLSDSTLSKLLRELKISAVPHGYRSSFRTYARHAHFPDDVAEFALGHRKRNKVEAAYARYRLEDETAKLFAAWSAYLQNEPAANVLEFGKRAGA